MLNKPKFMKPSTNKEECTIDIDIDVKEISFSCIIDGNEAITAWRIVIYDINDDTIVYDTEQVDLLSPFYPIDEKNRNVVFSVNLKDYPNKYENAKPFINRADAYYWTITFVGSSGNSITSYQEVFYANRTPTIKFLCNGKDVNLSSETPAILNSKDSTFKAVLDFDGDEYGAQLKKYGWRITDAGNGQVLVDTITKNQIYGSADNITCTYNGFLNGGNYRVELFVETQNNTKTTSHFDVSVTYDSTFLGSDFRVETLKNEPAVMLDWTKALVIAGILKDKSENVVSVDDTIFKANYPVDNQCSIEIPNGFKVVYTDAESLNFDIDENSYITFSTQLLSGEDVTLFSAEGTDGDEDGYYSVSRELKYSNGIFTYRIIGQNGIDKSVTCSVTNKPSEYVWYNIFMSPLIKTGDDYTVKLKIYEGRVENCIYPSEDLYPMDANAWASVGSADFYPIFGNWTNLKAEV